MAIVSHPNNAAFDQNFDNVIQGKGRTEESVEPTLFTRTYSLVQLECAQAFLGVPTLHEALKALCKEHEPSRTPKEVTYEADSRRWVVTYEL